jgi:acetyl-CoA carboxylase biotin carboxylase subunit
MAWAPSRLEAIRKLRRCLEEFTLEGFQTNAEFSYEILFHPAFVRGGYRTDFLEQHRKELLAFSKKLSEQTEGL